MGKRGTSAGQTESAKVQDDAERPVSFRERSDKKFGAKRTENNTPKELERSEADGSNLLSGPTKEDRRADYWRAPRGAEPSASTPMAGPKGGRRRLLPAGARHERRTGSSLRRERIGPRRVRASTPL